MCMVVHSRIVAAAIAVLSALALALPARAADVVSTPTLSQAPAGALYVEPRFAPELTHDGVIYGRAVNVAGAEQDLVLDVHQPATHTDAFRPVIVWAAGGGFVHNRGRDRTYWMPELVRRGYVVVSIEYRIRPDMPYGFGGVATSGDPEALNQTLAAMRDAQHDMQAAIRWVRANAADLRVDPGRIVAAGYSAGGFMSLFAAFNDDADGCNDGAGCSGNPGWPSHVIAAISGVGGYAPGLQGTIEPGSPPIMTLHGTHDTTVPIVASALPCAATIAVGNVCEAHVYPERGHSVGDELPEEMTAKSVDFLYRNVIATPRAASAFTGVTTATRGDVATVAGRLTSGITPISGARVLARSQTGAWVETVTGADGSFRIAVPAPDHGRSAQLTLRYEGHAPAPGIASIGAQPIAPTTTSATARWGQ